VDFSAITIAQRDRNPSEDGRAELSDSTGWDSFPLGSTV
jgi:hypothetical protein